MCNVSGNTFLSWPSAGKNITGMISRTSHLMDAKVQIIFELTKNNGMKTTLCFPKKNVSFAWWNGKYVVHLPKNKENNFPKDCNRC